MEKAWPSIEGICSKSGKSRRTVQRALKELDDRGVILRKPQKGTHEYHFLLERKFHFGDAKKIENLRGAKLGSEGVPKLTHRGAKIDTQIKQVIKQTNTKELTGDKKNSEERKRDALINELKKQEVSERVVIELEDKINAMHIKDAKELLSEYRKGVKANTIRNPGGYLINAISKDLFKANKIKSLQRKAFFEERQKSFERIRKEKRKSESMKERNEVIFEEKKAIVHRAIEDDEAFIGKILEMPGVTEKGTPLFYAYGFNMIKGSENEL